MRKLMVLPLAGSLALGGGVGPVAAGAERVEHERRR